MEGKVNMARPRTPYIYTPSTTSFVADSQLPTFSFVGDDPNGDTLEYQLQIHTDDTFPGGIDNYYFDASDAAATDPGTEWSNDSTAFDGNATTGATSGSAAGSTSAEYLMAEGTNAPTSGNTITLVRARVVASRTATNGNVVHAAIYTNGLAELLETATCTPTSTSPENGAWINLSTPSGGWTWQKVNDLEVKIYQTNNQLNTVNAYQVDVEVTTQGVLLDKFSVTPDAGFTSGHPFPSGQTVSYTVQAGEELTVSNTYYWRVRSIDPTGSNTYSDWSVGGPPAPNFHIYRMQGFQ